MGLNSGIHGKKPAYNCMSYGTVCIAHFIFCSTHAEKVNRFALEAAIKGRGRDKFRLFSLVTYVKGKLIWNSAGIMTGRRNPNDRRETFPTVPTVFLNKTWKTRN